MQSSVIEITPAHWAALNRLRDLTRMILAAIQQDDLPGVASLGREAQTLIDALNAQGFAGEAASPEMRQLMRDVVAAHGRLIEELRVRLAETEQELMDVRSTRFRLRASRLPEDVSGNTFLRDV